ncbi:pyridoxamine 5'-phosphate oxidase family protein [soil metagenome]
MKTAKQNKPQLSKIQDLILAVKVCMLVTESPNKSLFARPMQTQQMDEDGCLWFFSNEQTDKDQEIKKDAQVNISYADSNQSNYVSVSGKAEVVHDKAKMEELWSPIMKAWYPQGLETPGISLLKVEIKSAAYWDGSASTMVEVYKIAKAIVTGQQYEDGEHGKVQA